MPAEVTYRTDSSPCQAPPGLAPQTLADWLAEARIVPGKAREWRGAQPWSVGPRRMDSALWLWLGRGRGQGRIGADEFHLEPGEVLLARADVEHLVLLQPAEDLHFVTVHFTVQVRGGLDLLRLIGFPARLAAEPGAPYGPASRRLSREYALQAPGWQQAMSADLLGLLLHLLRECGDQCRPDHRPGLDQDLRRLEPALRLTTDGQAIRGPSVGRLARAAGVSEVHLRRLFHRVIGVGPAAYLQRQRIQRACALLRASSLPIKEVAATCGFSRVAFFYRAFRRWTGTTPARYREGEGRE